MSIKNLEPKLISGVIFTFLFVAGLILGLLIDKLPYFTVKPEVDVSALVAITALFMATIILPFKINSYISNQRNKNSIIVNDIDEILSILNDIKNLYEEVYNESRHIEKRDQRMLFSLFRSANNKIDLLCTQLEKSGLKNSEREVSLPFNKNVQPAFTEKFHEGSSISEQDCIKAVNEIGAIIATLKELRYKIFN